MPGRPARLLAYSHDGYGLGHLRRNLRLSAGLRRLRPDVEVVLATGARSPERVTAGHAVTLVRLPPVVKTGPGRYEPAGPDQATISDVVARRSAILGEVVADFAPDILLVDRHPRGLHRELDAALDIHRRRRPRARAVLGLRDILDEPGPVAREWADADLTSVIDSSYDAVLCYGDRSVYDLAAEYRLPGVVADRLRYTGYLTDDLVAADGAAIRARHSAGGRLAVCTLGGGQDAAGTAGAFLAAMERLAARNWRGILITGPYMAPADADALRGHPGAASTAIIRMVTDVPSYLAAADAVFCMGGYNTTCEVLGTGVPAVIVPRTIPRMEQLMRARRLADLGLITWLPGDALTGSYVAEALSRVAGIPSGYLRGRLATLARHGVRNTAWQLSGMLPDMAAPQSFGEVAHATR